MPDISVKNIKGVGAKTTQYLDKLGIRTVNDLLKHYPVRYLEYKPPTKIGDINRDEDVVIKATLTKTPAFAGGNKKVLTAKLTDYIDVIDVVQLGLLKDDFKSR